ncbi:MAG: mobilization protein [Methylococcaceae bacterium]|nr:mobilization protein [Methylococcaceae bacterium]
MATLSIDEQIKALEDEGKKKAEERRKKINQLKAKKQKEEARKVNDLLKGSKASDTRRKILLGACTADIMKKDEAAKNKFMVHLDKYLTRDDDRALFDLKPLTKVEEQSTPEN